MIKEYLLSNILFKKRLKLLTEKIKLYDNLTLEEDIVKYQIRIFNKTWKNAYTNIPFYIEWKKKHDLPEQVESINDLINFPILTKKDIHNNQELIFKNLEDFCIVTTGGTSGITTNFPTTNIELDEVYANGYLGRSWWGIRPFDNILMFWGHSHLFGKGFRKYIALFKREFSDFLINTTRVSSYSLRYENIEVFYQNIIKILPQVIISYSSNLYKICKHLESNNIKHVKNNLKGIILTSETVTDIDISMIEKIFCSSVIQEYGMAETGQIAYSYIETNNIRVFWDSFIVTTNENEELHLTTLSNKIFPLINYSSEDNVHVKTRYNNSVLSLSKINGKIRNILNIPFRDGDVQQISTIFFDHVLKNYSNIYSLHYRQLSKGIRIYIVSDIDLNLESLKTYFDSEILKEFPKMNSECIVLEQMNQEPKTVAGKSKVMLDNDIC
jgi:phenylacetate-CoA ligase